MIHYNSLQNGASPAQPSGDGGIFGWIGNLFSGIDPSKWNFNFPTNQQGSGSNFQPIYNFPNNQNNSSSNINPVTIGIVVLSAIVLIKLMQD